MDSTSTRILLIDDHEGDVLRVREMLSESGDGFELIATSTLAAGLELLGSGGFDAVLLDLDLPDCRGLAAFAAVQQAVPDLPVVVLAVEQDQDSALAAVKAGAQDYLFREEVTPKMLARSLRYAIERVKLRSALQASERRFQAISEMTSDYIYHKTILPDGRNRFDWVTEKFTVITGYTSLELDNLDASRSQIIHPDDMPSYLDFVGRVNRGKAGNHEHRIFGRDGKVIWLSINEKPLSRPEPGRPFEALGAATDITARKQFEAEQSNYLERLEAMVADRTETLNETVERLRHSNAILERIFNAAHFHIVHLDRDFNFIRVNQTYADSAARPMDFFSGKNYFDLFPHEENQSIFRQVVDSGEPFTVFAKPFTFPDHPEWGMTYWDWSLYPVKGKDGKTRELVFCLLDVTDKIRAEQALFEEKQRLFNVLESLPAAVSLVRPDFVIGFANRVFRETFGESEGRRCYKVLRLRDSPCPDCRSMRLFEQGRGESHYESDFPVGRAYEVYARNFGESGNAVLQLFIDITDRKKAEREREEAESRLEEQRTRAIFADRLRSLGEMATSIAHELNQPLVGVRGIAEHIVLAVKRGWRLTDSDLRDKAQTIVDQADRMSAIIEHSRMFVRGSQTQTQAPVDLNRVVNSALAMLSGQLRARGFDLRLELAPVLPEVMANQYALEEVILNLVSNARDACADKSFAGCGPTLTIRSGFDPEKVEVRLEVEDNGPGIPEEILPRLFDPFFTTKEVDRGTGLGLAIARSIIENYQGKIRVDSRKGEGARFTIGLPARQL